VVTEQKTEPASDAPSSIVTLTLIGVPVSINSELTLADAIVTVDFGKIAIQRIGRAVCSPQKTSRLLSGAIVVQATNLRPRT